ncbi:unnamed protein product [Rhizoctonia solani]|uniref:Protein kinase domain-containing protein n=1 Tax=Rhizoctonia solani TaxID=456999 RepID=A0A8H3D7A1_9AGAM|nr:unnamed protein product [Rhizoctonia solani]
MKIHGDIKGLNILVSDDYVPKLADFGTSLLSQHSLRFSGGGTSSTNFTIRYTAPEILMGTTKHTAEGDVYALGMTILEVITGVVPYAEIGEQAVFGKVMTKSHPSRPELDLPEGIEHADSLWSLLKQCWASEPHNRPVATETANKLQAIGTVERYGALHQIMCQNGPKSTSEILSLLDHHGCKDMTRELDLSRVSRFPILPGDNRELYRGELQDGRHVGLKCYGRSQIRKLDREKLLRQGVVHELYVWSKCRHPNILELLGAAHYHGQVAMVSSWMENMTLGLHLSYYPDADRYDLCLQLADAVAYLRDYGVVHGNIQGSNVLVSDDHVPKLTGFGNSFFSDCRYPDTHLDPTIALRWTAPEIILEETEQTFEGDVYALGMAPHDVLRALVAHGSCDLTGDIKYSTVRWIWSSSTYQCCSTSRVCDGTRMTARRVFSPYPYTVAGANEATASMFFTAREGHILSRCNNPHIQGILGVALIDNTLALISPELEPGHQRLYDMLRLKQGVQLPRCKMSVQLSDAVAYLHGQDIVHGDIKPWNVLISQDFNVHLTGFHNAFTRNTSLEFPTRERVIIEFENPFEAPELRVHEPKLELTLETDVYALGMTILCVMTHHPSAIWDELSQRPERYIPSDSEHGDALWTLLLKCGVRKPEDRPSAEHVREKMATFTDEGLMERGSVNQHRIRRRSF